MDDGYFRNDCEAVRISTESFTREENVLFVDCLRKNFDLDSRIHKKGKWLNIYIPQPQISQLRKLIEPHIIPSMRYKICPVTTDSVKNTEEIISNIRNYNTPTPSFGFPNR